MPNFEALKANPATVDANGVRYCPELSDKRVYTFPQPDSTTTVQIKTATPAGMAASLATGISLAHTTAPFTWEVAGTVAADPAESGKVLVRGFDKWGNFMTEAVSFNNSTTSGSFTKDFYCFPSIGYAYVIDNTLLDAGDDFKIIDSDLGTAVIVGNIDAATYDLAVPTPGIVVPPKAYAQLNYLKITGGDVNAATTYRLAVYDAGTGTTVYPKSSALDNASTDPLWYDKYSAPYTDLWIYGGLNGKVAYIDMTAQADESNVDSTLYIDYDLWALGTPGGIQGALEIADRTASTQQS